MGSIPDPLLHHLTQAPHTFLQPSVSLQSAALVFAKQLLDPIAEEVSSAQLARLQAHRKTNKRRRGDDEDEIENEVLRVKRVHTDGFAVNQVWEQVRRIAGAVEREVERALKAQQAQNGLANGVKVKEGHSTSSNGGLPDPVETVRFDEDGFEVGTEDEESEEELNSEDDLEGADALDENPEDDISDAEDEISDDILLDDDDRLIEEEDFHEDIEGEDGLTGMEDSEDENVNDDPAADFVEDVHGLNDGFFSIDDFNRQTDFLEQVDARGDPDDGAASDEEDVDWELDPFTVDPRAGGTSKSSQTKHAADEEDGAQGSGESDSEDDAEPAFGNMDLDAPEGFSDDEDNEEDEKDDGQNANNIMYADFFGPPARKRKNKKGRPHPHNFPAKAPPTNKGAVQQGDKPDDEIDITRAMAAVHRELYSDDEDDEPSEPEEELDPADPQSRRSTHERRQAALLREIRRLEAQNVSAKPWTLSGEAAGHARPLNSLLEEDLDFERAGKPVPVITKEVSESIEALIKRRVLAREFDEVIRRRPDELLRGVGAAGRRGLLEDVDDSKSKLSLGELYERDHLRRTDPNYVEERDERKRKEHAEIEGLWKDLAHRLDSLCSFSYKPRPAEMAVQVRSDAPVVMMEDARPAGVGGIEAAATSQLAPQEIYKPGAAVEGKGGDEVVTKGGSVVKRDELSREEKKRRRRRDKERGKKAGGSNAGEGAKPNGVAGQAASGKADSKGAQKARERKNVVGELKRGGVMVIGRKGELLDVEGKEVKGGKGKVSGGALKL